MASSSELVLDWKGESVYSTVMSVHDIIWVHSSAGPLGPYFRGNQLREHTRVRHWELNIIKLSDWILILSLCLSLPLFFLKLPLAFCNHPNGNIIILNWNFSPGLINFTLWLKRPTAYHCVISFQVPRGPEETMWTLNLQFHTHVVQTVTFGLDRKK